MNTENTRDEQRATSNGFTLAEAMMATVILGIAAAGILLPFTTGAKVQAEGIRQTLAAKLASDLMEQIISTEFDDIITEYGTYNESKGQIKDANDTVFTDARYANFSRNAICQYVTVSQQPSLEEDQCNFILVIVRVHYNDREIVTLSRLVAE
jgi:prepilin-type N-terminal cleavage/methylation domain-containing protein